MARTGDCSLIFVSLKQEVQVLLKSPSFVKGTGEQKEKICRNIL